MGSGRSLTGQRGLQRALAEKRKRGQPGEEQDLRAHHWERTAREGTEGCTINRKWACRGLNVKCPPLGLGI